MTLIGLEVSVANGRGILMLEVFEEGGEMVCGIYEIRGRLNERPKQWMLTMRSEMERVKQIAREAGCTELRLGGRDWSRVLPDFEPMTGIPNGLRTRL